MNSEPMQGCLLPEAPVQRRRKRAKEVPRQSSCAPCPQRVRRALCRRSLQRGRAWPTKQSPAMFRFRSRAACQAASLLTAGATGPLTATSSPTWTLCLTSLRSTSTRALGLWRTNCPTCGLTDVPVTVITRVPIRWQSAPAGDRDPSTRILPA